MEHGGLSDLGKLQSFEALSCGNMFSRWPKGEVGGGAHAIKPFPASLRELMIFVEPSMQSMGLLSNLTSLTSLSLETCSKLTMDGFNPHITVNLNKLVVCAYNDEQGNMSIAGDLVSEIARSNLMHVGSFQLGKIYVDSISGVLIAPICRHLSPTLHTLSFCYDQGATTFAEEQQQALQLLSSLKHLEFERCYNLQSLPKGLRGLSSLKRLEINSCNKIQCLPPKKGLPSSLESLVVYECNSELTEQARKLKGIEPWFSVTIHDDKFYY